MAELSFHRHGQEVMRVQLGERTTIGRGGECDVALLEPSLSRTQAEIERRPDGYWLVDRSGRGTAVGDAEVAEALLDDGAELRLGSWRALFRLAPSRDDDETRVSGGTAVRGAPDSAAGPARLRVREASGRERVFPLGAGAITVGKDGENDVVLADPYVSGRHLRLEPRGGRARLQDLGSKNGTFVGGARVVEAELGPGAHFTVGDTELSLEWGEPEPRARPAAFEGMISSDPGMRQVFDLLERVAPSDAAVAIFGETGTGKELVARALHARSQRRDGPFIPVNCSAIAETLIESELFGHERGAFSGAERLRKGAFEEADGGTLFLDEIGELPLELQPKLLRALELGEVKRVGSSRPIQVSVRVVAATHRDLRARVRAGRFREDLYYRLCVVPITVPPLRQRRGDVRALAQHFLAQAAPRGLALRWSEEALQKLADHDWPGNIRQLKNVVQRALLFRDEGLVLGPASVSFDEMRSAAPPAGADDDTLYVRGLTLEDIEREAIRLSLRRHKGKRAAVVKELQIAKSTVMKRIGQWGLQNEGRAGLDPIAAEDDGEDDE